MTEDQIKHMVDRFLSWKLPDNFNPDNGISFSPIAGEGGPHPFRREPSGTNLLDATQATAMVRHMLEGISGGVAQPPSHWAIEESTPNDGFECYFLLRDGITVGEFCGRQTDQRTRHLNDLVAAANAAQPPAAPVEEFQQSEPKSAATVETDHRGSSAETADVLQGQPRAQYIWAMLKSYMLDECSLECASISNADEKNLINLIINSLPPVSPNEPQEQTTGELFNRLLARINFDGIDPRTLSLSELYAAIKGAEWPHTPAQPQGVRLTDAVVEEISRRVTARADYLKAEYGTVPPDSIQAEIYSLRGLALALSRPESK